MSQTIYKYLVPTRDSFKEEIPTGAVFLTVQTQKNPLGQDCGQMWWEVDPIAPTELRQFFVVGTGKEIPDYAEVYLGTYQQGTFVWHLYTTYTTATLTEPAGHEHEWYTNRGLQSVCACGAAEEKA